MEEGKPNLKRKPWEKFWEIVSELGSGGQGTTFVVKRSGSDQDADKYVLKILHKQKDPERRRRMHREVQALQQLDHPRLPKIIESNTDAFDDVAVPLFFVMDYIDGHKLEDRVTESPLKPDEAIALVMELSDVVSYCHQKGIIHRDIKQDNILLRRRNIADPVLIDFGLSFNEVDADRSPITPQGQQLGNRLLHLPELQIGDSTKRHVESDISQVCAILFYVLTGKAPVHLEDHEGLKPHQRPSVKSMLDGIGSPALTSLFDKGFERVFIKRFRSFEALKGRLHEVRDEFRYSVGSFNETSETVTLENVGGMIGTTSSTRAFDETLSNQNETQTREVLNDLGGDEKDALAYASLLGSWNEKSDGDRDTIRKLIEGDN
ncbi:MAG TPA: serine/threonine-protein kinase [Pyrinomonadaceae bacterium]|nr:serine/threonine-protein kinase [Pyrinomonadaceae bacterium]